MSAIEQYAHASAACMAKLQHSRALLLQLLPDFC